MTSKRNPVADERGGAPHVLRLLTWSGPGIAFELFAPGNPAAGLCPGFGICLLFSGVSEESEIG